MLKWDYRLQKVLFAPEIPSKDDLGAKLLRRCSASRLADLFGFHVSQYSTYDYVLPSANR